jgi:hypothetical protein
MSKVTISGDSDEVSDGADIGDDANEVAAQTFQEKLRQQREDLDDIESKLPKQPRTKTRLPRRLRR